MRRNVTWENLREADRLEKPRCKWEYDKLDILLTVHHGTLMDQHQLDTLSLVCLLSANASTCFGRYSPIFRRLCTDAVLCNCVRRMCVDYVKVAVCVGCVLTACRLRCV
jgi:hypothetical protein